MLKSQELQRRQSEVREELSGLAANDTLTDEQRSKMTALDGEYRDNEAKYRAALISEDEQREQAGRELETREGKQWDDLVGQFELRQVALNLDEGRAIDGATAEVVQEMRSQGGYQGCPVPLQALEMRAGETVSTNTPDPVSTANIIGRLFPQSVAAAMGTRMVNVGSGTNEYPVLTDGVSSAWAGSETGIVGGPDQAKTSPFSLKPDHTLGTQVQITRKALKQSGNGLEQAIRRDMRTEIQKALDTVIFQGAGASGEPNGIVSKYSGYGITQHDASASSMDYSTFIDAVAAMMSANAATGMGDVRALVRSEVWSYADGAMFDAGSGITVWDKILSKMGRVVTSDTALAAPATNVSNLLLTTNAGGLAPIFCGIWGGLDVIRDVYTKAHSGQLLITGLMTCDVTASRAEQLRLVKVKSA